MAIGETMEPLEQRCEDDLVISPVGWTPLQYLISATLHDSVGEAGGRT